MWNYWTKLGQTDKTCAAGAITVLAVDTIFVGHAVLSGTYKYLPMLFEESFSLLSKIGLFFAVVKLMNSFIPKSAWFCEAIITVYSVLTVGCFGAMADTFVNEVKFNNQEERIDNMIRYIALIVLIVFFHYWRTEAKNALLAKNPQSLKEAPPWDKTAGHAIVIILSAKVSLFSFYYFHSENLSINTIRIGFMTIAVLFLLLIDILNGLQACQTDFPLNEMLFVVTAAVMMLFATMQLVIPIAAFTYFKTAIVYRGTYHIISVTTIMLLLFFFHCAAANEQQRKKKEEDAARVSLAPDDLLPMHEYELLQHKDTN